MPEITMPFGFGDLPIKPEMTGRVRISDDVQQSLATLLGWDGSKRRLVRTAQSGVLQSVTPQVSGLWTKTSSGANEVVTMLDADTTEVIVRGHPDNGELVWVNVGATASASAGWPLSANDHIVLSVDNLNKLSIMIVTTGNKVIVLYTR